MPDGRHSLDEPLVRLQDVTLRRGARRLLDGLSLDLQPGVTALLGPNGAGKSLTLRVIAGLIAPQEGALRHASGLAEATGLVFQRPVLLRRSVRANLAFALKAAGRGDDLHAATDALLARGRLSDLADQPARALSGGEQQRLTLVRALAAQPRLLLLDEPTASLDPEATAAVETILRAVAEQGVAIAIVTHDLGQARRLADSILFLNKGRLVEHGPAQAFLTKPRTEAARAFLEGRLIL